MAEPGSAFTQPYRECPVTKCVREKLDSLSPSLHTPDERVLFVLDGLHAHADRLWHDGQPRLARAFREAALQLRRMTTPSQPPDPPRSAESLRDEEVGHAFRQLFAMTNRS